MSGLRTPRLFLHQAHFDLHHWVMTVDRPEHFCFPSAFSPMRFTYHGNIVLVLWVAGIALSKHAVSASAQQAMDLSLRPQCLVLALTARSLHCRDFCRVTELLSPWRRALPQTTRPRLSAVSAAFRLTNLLQCMSLVLAVRPEGANHQWRRIHPDSCRLVRKLASGLVG